MNVYEKNQKQLPYDIEYKAIKHTYFRIRKDHVHITTSKRTKKSVIIHYLDLHFDRLYQKLMIYQDKQDNQSISLWGKTYDINIHEGPFSYALIDNTCHIWHKNDAIDRLKKAIYFKELALKIPDIEQDLYPIISRDGITLRPIKIKYLKSKFGSYHRKKDEITLNAFLATMPIEYLTYVIYHEYAHILVFNHSKAFYDQLGKWLPNHKRYQKALKNIAIY
ncbi:MAG: M48 family metallopeptidase [Acholeplasmataceae bacterium]